MRDLIRYIKSVVKKQEPEEPQEDESSEFSSGAMKLSWEASTGDFEVDRTQEIDEEFYAKVLLHWASLDNQDMESTQEEPIVGPSQVFSFKHR